MGEFIALNRNSCQNCYKCIRNCPVKSIKFSGNQASIVHNECILCGHCYVVCPQNAKEIVSGLETVKVLLQQNENVIVSLAPSFVANYNGASLKAMKNALMKLGFYDVEETAIGAAIVKKEYEDYLEEKQPRVLITSACHSVNLLIQKYFPHLLGMLAPILSPMQAHAQKIKSEVNDAKVVFIGPCIAKKDEADYYEGYVDGVLTFEELSNWLKFNKIEIEEIIEDEPKYKSRFFPTTGGIIKSLSHRNSDYNYIAVDGVQNCINVLTDITKGQINKCFIEMSACVGSCINGPIMEKYHKTPLRDYLQVINYAGKNDIDIPLMKKEVLHKEFKTIRKKLSFPSESEILNIMKEMGKESKNDELNCGSCGYDSCREKAIAIYQGKANFSMCLPFLKERAENFYNNILNHAPNGIIVLNENLEIQQINNAAKRIINITNSKDVLGEKVIKVLKEEPFKQVLNNKRSLFKNKRYLAEYNRHVEESIIYDRNYHIIMYLMNDITEDINQKKQKEVTKQHTVDVANKVVEKQMRIVQEIASLLGETAAETKIALTKLKEQISDE